MALASIVISTIFVFLVAFFQFSGAVNAMTNAAVTASRATAICNDEKTAKTMALNVAKIVLSRNKAIRNVSVNVQPVSFSHATGKFEPGQLVKVTVNSRIHTIEPYIVSRNQISRSYVVMIEGMSSGSMLGVKADEKSIFNALTHSAVLTRNGKSYHLNKAAALAIMGNMKVESNFRPTIQNSIGAYGLCQWLGGRKSKLMSLPNYQTAGVQLQYLMSELNSGKYNKVQNALILVCQKGDAATIDDARRACDIFNRKFEVSGTSSAVRQAYVSSHWNSFS